MQQKYRNIEVLIVDDGSTDASANIIMQYVDKDDRIRYFYQNNAGPSVARNKAIQHAIGKYLLFVDADDYVSNDYIENLVCTAEENDSELVIAGYTLVYEDGKTDVVIIPSKYEKCKAEEWAYRISACCSRLYLKEFWSKNNLQFYPEKDARAEDVPIALYANAMAKRIRIVKDAGYFYYQHNSSAMNNKSKEIPFIFPYRAFENMYTKMKASHVENSMDYYWFGVLKFLAQFEFVIYRKASKKERDNFYKYIGRLIGSDWEQMVFGWRRIRYQIDLPFVHRCAIELFIYKYKRTRLG